MTIDPRDPNTFWREGQRLQAADRERLEACSVCLGSGIDPAYPSEHCPFCYGTGKLAPKSCGKPFGREILLRGMKPGTGLRAVCMLSEGHTGDHADPERIPQDLAPSSPEPDLMADLRAAAAGETRECSKCIGYGELFTRDYSGPSYTGSPKNARSCDACKGSGRIPIPLDARHARYALAVIDERDRAIRDLTRGER